MAIPDVPDCGQLGKQDNCRAAVSLSLASRHASLPVSWLHLPEEWAQDAARWRGKLDLLQARVIGAGQPTPTAHAGELKPLTKGAFSWFTYDSLAGIADGN